MEQFINKGDIVILGNRYEAQLCAIEMDARCIVICEGAAVSKTIIKVAQEKNCAIIVTDYDTYTCCQTYKPEHTHKLLYDAFGRPYHI